MLDSKTFAAFIFKIAILSAAVEKDAVTKKNAQYTFWLMRVVRMHRTIHHTPPNLGDLDYAVAYKLSYTVVR